MRRLLVAAVMLLPFVPTSASATGLQCPIATDTLISQAVGSTAEGGIMTDPLDPTKPLDNGPDTTACIWDTDVGDTVFVTRQAGMFGPGGATGPLEVAVKASTIPDDARQQVQAMRDAGITDINLPTFQISTVDGMGDAAVYVLNNKVDMHVVSSNFIVQRGLDAYTFGVIADDELSAKPRAHAVAEAVLASLP